MYVTKTERHTPNPSGPEMFDVSNGVPEWFKVRQKPLAKSVSTADMYGVNGTTTMISRATGSWITVKPSESNTRKQVGKNGPFAKKANFNIHRVSDLSPAWMQANRGPKDPSRYISVPAHKSQKFEPYRTFLMDINHPKRSVFAIGDYRHNVNTKKQAQKHTKQLSSDPKDLYGWNPIDSTEITPKIGAKF